MPRAESVKWTREHRLIALNLYFKIPFGKMHARNPVIIETAKKLGRSPNSLAIKLCNFASFDPVLRARGIAGMRGAANEDRSLWQEFQTHLSTLAPASEQLLHDLFTKDDDREVDFFRSDKVRLEPSNHKLNAPTGPTEVGSTVKARRGQQFFRQAILNAYNVRCCISGINVPRLLVASHIRPWGEFPDDRLKPSNGLCLSSIHDAAFDSGLITLDEQLKVVLSKRLKSYFPQPTLEYNFAPFAGQSIRLPEQLAEPNVEFLAYHRESVFQD